MKNSFLYIKTNREFESKVFMKLNLVNVSIYDAYCKNNNLYIKIEKNDYSKVKKYIKSIKFEKVKYTGKEYYLEEIKHHKYSLIAVVISIVFIFFASNVIVDIKIIHEDADFVNMLYNELERYNITKFSLKKDYKYLQKVKKEIKNRHLDSIDWLEINRVGMKYIVKVEKRVINEHEIKKEYCNLYATKNGLIKKMKVYNGETTKNINDYVKKGDLLISGDIHLNEEIVSTECADGEVYAETWYRVNVEVPLIYKKTSRTGKVRNNFVIDYNGVKHQLLKDRLPMYEKTEKLIFDLLGIKIYLKKEHEIINELEKYTQNEALEEAINIASKKIKDKLQKNDKIIEQKILQNTIIDSKMNVDIFIIVEEKISIQKEERKDVENDL